MKIELTEKEIQVIIELFNLADAYLEERGVDVPQDVIKLIEKLKEEN
jgi:hypothetical protein